MKSQVFNDYVINFLNSDPQLRKKLLQNLLNNKLEIQGEFNDIYSDHINKQIAETLQQISELRKQILTEENTLLPPLAHVSLGEQFTAIPGAAQN